MRPFDEIPFEESDYSDVALLVAGVREFPADDFARDLDASVARRFEPEAAGAGGRGGRPARTGRGWPSRWMAGPAVGLVAAGVAVVIVMSNGGLTNTLNGGNAGQQQKPIVRNPPHRNNVAGRLNNPDAANHALAQRSAGTLTTATTAGSSAGGIALSAGEKASSSAGVPTTVSPPATSYQAVNATSVAPVAPGAHQIQSAQISLTTQNVHVEQVAQEVINVVTFEHGTVQNSRITAATSNTGGGYAYFSLSFPTSDLQAALTQLSRLHFASVTSRTDGSQNVSNQYNSDVRQLGDAQALRASLLKQLQTAYTQQDIDSIKAQLKLAEQQITSWQNTLGSLQHKISYSDVEVQINQNGLPILPVTKHHSSGFTVGKAGHDALRVLVVSAGVALIALAVMIPVGLVVALLMWLWVWLRQRRREHALDATT